MKYLLLFLLLAGCSTKKNIRVTAFRPLSDTSRYCISIPEKQLPIKDFISIKDLGCSFNVDCGKILTQYAAKQPVNAVINLYIPAGKYYFETTFYVEDRQINLFGEGIGKSIIYVKDGVNGIWLDRKKGILPPNYLSGFWMVAYGKTNPEADSIRVWHQTTINGVAVGSFGGNGIHIDGFVTGKPENDAAHNASLSKIYDCSIGGNGHDGILIDGADGNACVTIGNDIRNNGGWGLRESSFLGGTHIGNMFHANKLGPFTVDHPTNASCFLGGYTEGDQPPGLIFQGNQVVGKEQFFFRGKIQVKSIQVYSFLLSDAPAAHVSRTQRNILLRCWCSL